MHKDPYVFAQLVRFLDRSKFNRIVAKYEGDKYIKSYTCWNQLLTMIFGQLSNRESLRDLVVAMEAHAGKHEPSSLPFLFIIGSFLGGFTPK